MRARVCGTRVLCEQILERIAQCDGLSSSKGITNSAPQTKEQ